MPLPHTLHARGAVLCDGADYVATVEAPHDEALARRLALCYAACRGVPDERLEAMAAAEGEPVDATDPIGLACVPECVP